MEKSFLKGINTFFLPLGFVYQKKSWYLDSGDLVKIVNLQKSNYSDAYYINLSYYIKEIGCDEGDTQKHPLAINCAHLTTRADDWLSEEEMIKLNEMIIGGDAEEAWSLLRKTIELFFDPIHSVGDLKNRIDSDKKFKNSATRRLKEFFGMSVDE